VQEGCQGMLQDSQHLAKHQWALRAVLCPSAAPRKQAFNTGNCEWDCDTQHLLYEPLQRAWVCSQELTVRGGQVASDIEISLYPPTSSSCLHDCAFYQAAWRRSWHVCHQGQVDCCFCSTFTSCEPQQQSLSWCEHVSQHSQSTQANM